MSVDWSRFLKPFQYGNIYTTLHGVFCLTGFGKPHTHLLFPQQNIFRDLKTEPSRISLLKVNNRNIRTRSETCSKLTTVNLEHILCLLWTACWEMFTKHSTYGFQLTLFPTVIFSSFNITFTGFLSILFLRKKKHF